MITWCEAMPPTPFLCVTECGFASISVFCGEIATGGGGEGALEDNYLYFLSA